jgi:Ca2+-transporting ATPase
MNLVTDGLPALALGVEPAERAIMRRPPRPPKESLFAGGLGFQIVWIGGLMGLVTIALFAWATGTRDLTHGRTMVFFTLTAFQMFNVLAMRSERESLLRIRIFSNPKLVGAILLTFFVQLAVTYAPALNPIFHTTPLGVGELAACLAAASTVFFAIEGEKWFRFHRRMERAN